MKALKSFAEYLFFTSYSRLIVQEKQYTYLILRIVLAVDKMLNFRYLKKYARRQHAAFSLEDEKQIIALIKNNVIDIGSGMGYWGLHLMGSGREIVAIELSRPYIQLTKLLGVYSSVILASADVLPIRSDYFDTALALEIIEHLGKQRGQLLIEEAKRVSNRLILSTPQNPSSNLDLPKWVPKTEHHLSRWTKENFQVEGFTTSTLGESFLAVYFRNIKNNNLRLKAKNIPFPNQKTKL